MRYCGPTIPHFDHYICRLREEYLSLSLSLSLSLTARVVVDVHLGRDEGAAALHVRYGGRLDHVQVVGGGGGGRPVGGAGG